MFEDFEVVSRQVGHEPAVFVEDADVYLDELNAGAKRGFLRLLGKGGGTREQRRQDGGPKGPYYRVRNYEPVLTRATCRMYFFFPSFCSQASLVPSGDQAGNHASLVSPTSRLVPLSSITISFPPLTVE